ncbi:hypothetical protein LZ31DRAFT_26511 [Colletotrichum somersetense]|nr:hypothetical protein LZ31DRAFT_26511 [Colletotrichum somersetense]
MRHDAQKKGYPAKSWVSVMTLHYAVLYSVFARLSFSPFFFFFLLLFSFHAPDGTLGFRCKKKYRDSVSIKSTSISAKLPGVSS